MSASKRGSSICNSAQKSLASLRTDSGHLLRDSAKKNIMGTVSAKKEVNKNVAILSVDELHRIKMQCSMGDSSSYYQQQNAQERLELKQKSDARVQNWPNTIDALRKKKDDERMRRLEDEEIERRKLDMIEYELQEQARQDAIKKANLHVHNSQDQVKAFHSKMLLCDTLQEREQQQQLKKRRLEMEKQIELQWQELAIQKMNEHDEKLRQKLMAEYEKKVSNAKVVQDQLFEFKVKYIKRYQEERLEGQLLKKQAEEEMDRQRKLEHERKLKQLDQREGFKKANEDLKKQQQADKVKELEQEAKIQQYAQKKEAIEQLRRDKEEQKFREKQMTKQRLVDKQFEHLKSLKNREDEILGKQVADAEEKAYILFEEKERKRYEQKQQIEQSRVSQINKKLNDKEQAKKEEEEFTEMWKIRNLELEIAKQQEIEEDRLRAEEHKMFLQRQIDTKQAKAENEFKLELMEQAKAQALLDQNEKKFYSYAEQCISQWEENGKNIKPLILELKNYKKRTVV